MLVGTRHTRALWRTVAVPFLVAGLVVPAYSQSGRGTGIIAAESAPVLLLPDRARMSLRTLAAGTPVFVIGAEGEWLHIEFQDERFGLRIGYVLKVHVKIEESTAAGELAKRLAAAQAAARKSTETDSPRQDGTLVPSTTCRRVACIPAEDLMRTRPPVVSQQISFSRGTSGPVVRRWTSDRGPRQIHFLPSSHILTHCVRST